MGPAKLDIVEVYEFLRVNMYILSRGQDSVLSRKFKEDLESAKRSMPMRVVPPTAPISTTVNWPSEFMKFIISCKIPRTIEVNGKSYDANKYSETAMKEFQRMLTKEKIDLNMLIKSTTLYYASHRTYKKKIGNYILDGDWRSDYLELMAKAESGEESLKKHINQELNGDQPHSQWT